MNFARMMLSEPAKRRSGSTFVNAAAQTISEGGMPDAELLATELPAAEEQP
jgi:hypothetical protein